MDTQPARPRPDAPRPYICIYASQVAMCIGANRHKKISEAVELMWHRASPAGLQAALRRNAVRTDEDHVEDILRAQPEVRGLVDATLTSVCDSSDQVAERYDDLARGLRAVPLPDEDRRLVDDVLKRNLYTSYGNVQEQKVLEYVNDTLGIACHPDPVFYKKQQGCARTRAGAELPWFVGGKIDAIDSGRSLLIEIKNRVNRLFYRVPFYEQVQVQAYLHLLDLDRGVLVECLKVRRPAGDPGDDPGGDAARDRAPQPDAPAPAPARVLDPDTTVNVIPIHRDRQLWDSEIVPKLAGFVDFLAALLDDTALQDRYLQSKRRSAMVTAHVNAHMRRARAG
jgi:hypothetical protein